MISQDNKMGLLHKLIANPEIDTLSAPFSQLLFQIVSDDSSAC